MYQRTTLTSIESKVFANWNKYILILLSKECNSLIETAEASYLISMVS